MRCSQPGEFRVAHADGNGDGMNPPVAPGGRAPLFLSYAREDQKRARQIISALERSGHAVWWDGLLQSGARFAELTEQALDAAPAVVVLWSATSVTSHWVHDEASSGRDRGCLVPVSLDGSAPPIGFRQFQVIDLSAWHGSLTDPQFVRVLRGIDAACATHQGAPSRATAVPAPSSQLSRRTLMIGGTVAAVAAAGGLVAWQGGLFGGGAGARSIAVLPFDNIGGDPSRAYFAEGLSAELRSQLSRNAALQVMAGASSAAYADSTDTAVVIARRLGVAFLVDGNVRWEGDAARIAVELIDRATGSARWSKQFDLAMGDIFAVQSEIASAVSAALAVEIVDADNAVVGGTNNATAYDQYLRGRDLYNRAASEAMDRDALAHFDAAIAADPGFAAAHAARARSLTVIGGLYGDLAQTRSNYAAALAAARRAVALAPDHAESQSTLGYVLAQAHLDARAARQPFERSRALGDGDATVLARYAEYAALTAQASAAQMAVDRALLLDPLNPRIYRMKGRILTWARDYAAALAPLRRALELDPELSTTQAAIGAALYLGGDHAQAYAAYALESSDLHKQTGLAITAHRLGRTGEAAAARQRIIAGLGSGQVTYYQQAQIASQWGEAQAAMQALAAARRAGDLGLSELKVDPLLDPVRQHADFASLLSALHFD